MYARIWVDRGFALDQRINHDETVFNNGLDRACKSKKSVNEVCVFFAYLCDETSLE